jgi:hypothetical protein
MKIQIGLILLINLCTPYLQAQSGQFNQRRAKTHVHSIARFVGKYELDGSVIQFALGKKSLILIVPGSPVQQLRLIGKNKFRSTVFKDQYFVFEESNGKVTAVTSEGYQGTSKGKKISDTAEILSMTMDSLLVLRKATEHFIFMYNACDSSIIDTLATGLEKNYKRILSDFKLKKIPDVTVRVYPDLDCFHKGINFPGAPDQVLATAFGKDDVRMVSPRNAGPESWMLAYFAPHEFTHVVHLTMDYAPNNPRWLWEGVAQYEAGWFFNPAEFEFMKQKQFPVFADLANGMEYMLGYVIIEAIKDLWGFEAVISLIKNRGDCQKTLKTDQKSFEEKVYEHIYKKYVQR